MASERYRLDAEASVAAAADHAISAHGHEDTPELRDQIRGTLEPESAYTPGERQAEPFPG